MIPAVMSNFGMHATSPESWEWNGLNIKTLQG